MFQVYLPLYSLYHKLTDDHKKALDAFVDDINKAKVLGEIQKLMFDRSHFLRFLIVNDFDTKKAMAHF